MLGSISFRQPRLSDLPEYTGFLQRTYEDAYRNDALGLTPDRLSAEVFASEAFQDYLRSKLQNSEHQQSWLAQKEGKLIGAITAEDDDDDCRVSTFYVAPELQGKGIGKLLWSRAVKFAGARDIVIDLFAHSTKTFDMYKKWGFEIDVAKGENGVFFYHWRAWPKDFHAKAYYMRQKALRRTGIP